MIISSETGARPVLRFALPAARELAWDDVVRGRIAFQSEVLDDFVLVRSDGLPTYNFACVVDDIEMRITHVIRGDDHISNTPRQLLLYAMTVFSTALPNPCHRCQRSLTCSAAGAPWRIASA